MENQAYQPSIYTSTINGEHKLRNKIRHNLGILGNDIVNLGAGLIETGYRKRENYAKAAHVHEKIEAREQKNIEYALNSALLNLDFSGENTTLFDALSESLGKDDEGIEKTLGSVAKLGERFIPIVGGYLAKSRATREEVYGILKQINDYPDSLGDGDDMLGFDSVSPNNYQNKQAKLLNTANGLSVDTKRVLKGLGSLLFDNELGYIPNLVFRNVEITAKDRLRSVLDKAGPITFDTMLLASGGGVIGKYVLGSVAPGVAGKVAGYGAMKLTEIAANGVGAGIGAGANVLASKYGTDENGLLTTTGKYIKGAGDMIQGSLMTTTRTGLQGALGGANTLPGMAISAGLALGSVGAKTVAKYTLDKKLKDKLEWTSLGLETGMLANVGIQLGNQAIDTVKSLGYSAEDAVAFLTGATTVHAATLDQPETQEIDTKENTNNNVLRRRYTSPNTDNLGLVERTSSASTTPTGFEYKTGGEGEVFNAEGWTPFSSSTVIGDNWSEGLDYIFDNMASSDALREWFSVLDRAYEGNLSDVFTTGATTDNDLVWMHADNPTDLIQQLSSAGYDNTIISNLLGDLGIHNLNYHPNDDATMGITQLGNEDFVDFNESPSETYLNFRQIEHDGGFVFAFDPDTLESMAIKYECGNPLVYETSDVKVKSPTFFKAYGGITNEGIIRTDALHNPVEGVGARLYLFDKDDSNGLMFGNSPTLALGNTIYSDQNGEFVDVASLFDALFDGDDNNSAFGTTLTDDQLMNAIVSGELGLLLQENIYQNNGQWFTSGFGNMGPMGTNVDAMHDNVIMFYDNELGFWNAFGYRPNTSELDLRILNAQTWQGGVLEPNVGVIFNGYIKPPTPENPPETPKDDFGGGSDLGDDEPNDDEDPIPPGNGLSDDPTN